MPFDLDDYHQRPVLERGKHLFQNGLYVIEEDEELEFNPESLAANNIEEEKEIH